MDGLILTGIVDIGLGNVSSVAAALTRLGHAFIRVTDPEAFRHVQRLIICGVCSFDAFMDRLRLRDMETPLLQLILQEQIPVLGICLGFHILTQGSAEGHVVGLNALQGHTEKLSRPEKPGLLLPHYGWKQVCERKAGASLLLNDIPTEARQFYFSHSYSVHMEQEASITADTVYDSVSISAVVEHGNIAGVQFHPERSGAAGQKLLDNFVKDYDISLPAYATSARVKDLTK